MDDIRVRFPDFSEFLSFFRRKPRPHIATALGVAACQAGFTVLFTSVPNLVIKVRERARIQEMTTFKRRFCRYNLVILDELGYVSFDKASSEILFNLLSTRSLRKKRRKKNLRPKKPMGPKPDENSLPPI